CNPRCVGSPALWRDVARCCRGGNRNDRARNPDPSDVEAEVAGLLDRSTPELRLAWHEFHHARPPSGLRRDLLIRALGNQLQERSYGGVSRALRRPLQSLARAAEKGAVDPSIVLKAGTTPGRPWRPH